jgi:CheY-like chemotaxis protein
MPRVLVIDDQPQVRAMIYIALKANGFDVVAVESGRLGLIELNKTAFDVPLFDVAIVDIYMPDMDGVTLIKAMREYAPKLPIVAISGALFHGTGRTVLDILPNALHLSGIKYLQKPFRPQALVQAIQGAIGVPA